VNLKLHLPTVDLPGQRTYVVTHLVQEEASTMLYRGVSMTLPCAGKMLLPPLMWTAIPHDLRLTTKPWNLMAEETATVLLMAAVDSSPSELGLLVECVACLPDRDIVTRAFNLLDKPVILRKGEHISRLVCV
jgi:hypothetical protein